MHPIDEKIERLRAVTVMFLFREYYPHTGCEMWKILNQYTSYSEEKFVLCPVSDGIEKALDVAIECITKAHDEYFYTIKS